MTPSSNLERGFRRLLVVLSVSILVAGVSIDTVRFSPRETLRIYVRDGRSVDIYPAYGWRRSAKREQFASIVNTLMSAPNPVKASDIEKVEVVSSVIHEWWNDAQFTTIALAVAPLLWIAFFAVRWIVRGFASRSSV